MLLNIAGKFSCLGIDIGVDMIKVVQLKKRKGNIILSRYDCVKTPGGAVGDGKVIDTRKISICLKGIKKKYFPVKKAVISLGSENVMFSLLALPPMGKGELLKCMKFEAEKHISLPIKQVVYDYCLLRYLPEGHLEILLAAAPKEVVNGYMEALQGAGLYPTALEVEPLAMLRLFNYLIGRKAAQNNREGKYCLLLDLGVETSKVILVKGRYYKFFRCLPLGKKVLEGHGKVNTAAGELVKVLQQTIGYFVYRTSLEDLKIEKLYLTGGLSEIAGLQNYLVDNLKIQTEPLELLGFLHHDYPGSSFYKIREDKKLMYTAAGLALRGWSHG
ncbi:type IV pilus biogenesis protein PilM [Candidatus Contubernalis alkaliaceticus]|uniref:type IV pilus biogenesis protein PilM n=1 Tax=Candidatus Contubernalis alkaliaceticus TaxID=338645 RepID=UPI001F4BECEB|nr:pilus assembly protein PilM [Candidatus Contubernalis alkalaceticus]UNC92570.1 pilus assembly protein PilM [Candidatus Contubernalis alkalaceticus]